jgi:hypothetical protein
MRLSLASHRGADAKGESRDDQLFHQDAGLTRTTAVDMVSTTDSELRGVTVVPGHASHQARAERILDEQVAKVEQAGGEVARKN